MAFISAESQCYPNIKETDWLKNNIFLCMRWELIDQRVEAISQEVRFSLGFKQYNLIWHYFLSFNNNIVSFRLHCMNSTVPLSNHLLPTSMRTKELYLRKEQWRLVSRYCETAVHPIFSRDILKKYLSIFVKDIYTITNNHWTLICYMWNCLHHSSSDEVFALLCACLRGKRSKLAFLCGR